MAQSAAAKKWAATQVEASERGMAIAQQAHDDAVEYIAELASNMGNDTYRLKQTEAVAVELGAAASTMDNIIPMYHDMRKNMGESTGLSEQAVSALTSVYLAKYFQNLAKALTDEATARS